jgi:prepilin-type N-terminal cleavage/methylation domain-containing protein
MLRSRQVRFAPSTARGFSLIEMMVSVVIGMIVAAGAVTLIVAISRSNSENIQATRLNQELRALSSVIGDEIKRARRLHDPIAFVGQVGTNPGTFDNVDFSTAGCLLYGYQDLPLSDGTVAEDAGNNYEAIYLKSGSIVFARDSSAVTCSTDGQALNSSQLTVTGLTFSCVTTNGTTLTDPTTYDATKFTGQTCNQINMTLKAKLSTGDTYEKTIERSYVQQIFIRSGAAKSS